MIAFVCSEIEMSCRKVASVQLNWFAYRIRVISTFELREELRRRLETWQKGGGGARSRAEEG